MKLLREYLEFRSWILNGRSSELLFFHVVDGRGLPSTDFPSLENNFSTKFYNKLQGVFVSNSSKNIPPRLVRKFKSLTLHHLRHSPMLVSAVLNHTERTNAQFYSGVTDKQQKEEFGGFWASMLEAAKRFSSESQVGGIPIAAGHCDGLNDPVAEIPVVTIEPDCNSQYGCLYCIHYLVHSDEADIHKLMSFKYVVEAIRENAPNFEFSEEVLKGVIVRISFILEGISKRSKSASDLIGVMNKKVFELGILTPSGSAAYNAMRKWGSTSDEKLFFDELNQGLQVAEVIQQSYGKSWSSADFVLCRDLEGNPTAVFGKPYWDFNPMRLRANKIWAIRFDGVFGTSGTAQNSLTEEIKWILFCLLFFVSTGHIGRMSVSMLSQYFLTLRTLRDFAMRRVLVNWRE